MKIVSQETCGGGGGLKPAPPLSPLNRLRSLGPSCRTSPLPWPLLSPPSSVSSDVPSFYTLPPSVLFAALPHRLGEAGAAHGRHPLAARPAHFSASLCGGGLTWYLRVTQKMEK